MEISDLLRHRIIKSRMAQRTEKADEAATDLWAQMAVQIISIVGEDGFNSLYARSVFLTQSAFPWLVAGLVSAQNDRQFLELKTSLEGQTPAEASAANSLLLITFTDILAALIGEQLTTNVLRSAWDIDAAGSLGEELINV
ncbi:MAG: hypothetical protein HHJ09_14250 [Glaciimonas sp.]|nr:hypothetical protein [Glaciimonas sp.]